MLGEEKLKSYRLSNNIYTISNTLVARAIVATNTTNKAIIDRRTYS